MEKILSDAKKKRTERNEAIRKEYTELIKIGSDKTATYQHLAKKYGLATTTIVYIVATI